VCFSNGSQTAARDLELLTSQPPSHLPWNGTGLQPLSKSTRQNICRPGRTLRMGCEYLHFLIIVLRYLSKLFLGNEMGVINYAKQLLCKTSIANLELTLRPCKCNISSCRKRCPLSLSIKTDLFNNIHSWSFTW